MDKIATENLFLLEFLVDNVRIESDAKNVNAEQPGETCVAFQFLDNAPLDVCEADFSPQRDYNKANEDTKSGKSCLFSLSPDQAVESTKQFDIFVTVFKKMQPGWLPERVDLGAALISICNLFNELINSVETSNGTTPTAKTLKDVFDVTNAAEQIIGKIGVYIRMSCFGKLIVTQFQMNLNDKSVLFKDKEGKSLYRYKKAGKSKKDGCNLKRPESRKDDTKPCVCAQRPSPGGDLGLQGNPSCPFPPCLLDNSAGLQTAYGQWPCVDCDGNIETPCYAPAPGTAPSAVGNTPAFMTPCIECGSMPYAPCMLPPLTPGNGQYNQGYRQPSNTPCEECASKSEPPCAAAAAPDGNYQEIGASMGGNSLTIRVHKDKNKVEQVDPNCTYVSDVTDGCLCIPGKPGRKSKQQVQSFNMRPGVQQGNQNMPFAFKMGTCGDRGDNNVVVNPPVATSPDGTQFTEFSDPNKELFILRIGKKSEGIDRKQNLELELCTPKGPVLKPIPKQETRDTQYDPLDCGVEESEKPPAKGGKKKEKPKDKKKKK